MKKVSFSFIAFVLLLASSCQKCYQCTQYCAYCKSAANTGIVYKFCAENDVNHLRIDSFKTAFQDSGFSCSLLNNDKRVCDRSDKINDALNYYLLEDYYCYPKQ